MSLPITPDTPNPLGEVRGAFGNLPVSDSGGIIFQEYVHVERDINGTWELVAENMPATFDPLNLQSRTSLELWSHKPLLTVWIAKESGLKDGDRLIRYTGDRWYVRGMPRTAHPNQCIEAMVEYMLEDKVFDPIFHGEPE